MKKFGRKLVLSGLALAATAATLSTSTYAWYVSNTSADVDGGTAATMAGTSSGNLLVAQNVTKTDLGSLTAGKGAFSNSINICSAESYFWILFKCLNLFFKSIFMCSVIRILSCN